MVDVSNMLDEWHLLPVDVSKCWKSGIYYLLMCLKCEITDIYHLLMYLRY